MPKEKSGGTQGKIGPRQDGLTAWKHKIKSFSSTSVICSSWRNHLDSTRLREPASSNSATFSSYTLPAGLITLSVCRCPLWMSLVLETPLKRKHYFHSFIKRPLTVSGMGIWLCHALPGPNVLRKFHSRHFWGGLENYMKNIAKFCSKQGCVRTSFYHNGESWWVSPTKQFPVIINVSHQLDRDLEPFRRQLQVHQGGIMEPLSTAMRDVLLKIDFFFLTSYILSEGSPFYTPPSSFSLPLLSRSISCLSPIRKQPCF